MNPIYTPDNTNPAYQLNWGLTLFWRQSPVPDRNWLSALKEVTESDCVRVLKHQVTSQEASQFFISTKPSVSPPQLIRSVKGRLQHLIRQQLPKAFRRNYCLRSIGSATRETVEEYVANQRGHHRMADPRVQERLAEFQKSFPRVDLSKPAFSAHGEYWYNLHLVIVNAERWMEIRHGVLRGLLDMVQSAASKHAHRLSHMALLADHLHLTLGCPIDQSPEEIALGYLNNCAYACGMKPVFRMSYYVGTIGEYDRGAV
jgi:REP element-mobilizing transposase RayT